MNRFSQRSRNSLVGIHPDLVRLMNEAIKHSPIDFTITDGVRTVAQQQLLYDKGRTTPGNIVTKADGITSKSNHQIKEDGYGYAVDLYPYWNGKVQVADANGLKLIADHIKKVATSIGVNITWGGDWTSLKDYPHFELR